MTIAVYESRLANLGGGGRHALMLALALAERAEVEMWHQGPLDPVALRERWGAPIEGVRFREVPTSLEAVSALTTGLHGFINAAQGRFVRSRARRSVFLSFFPTGVDRSPGGRVRWLVGSLIRATGLRGALPVPLRARLTTLPTRAEIAALAAYDAIWVNSEYSRRWARHYWGRDAGVLYPPIEAIAPAQKANLILHVGRFFVGGHHKRHDVLIAAFRELLGRLSPGHPWELDLVGGITPGGEHRAYADRISALAQGLPIRLRFGALRADVAGLYGRAALYWHATGYGADLARHPDQAEHFGMSIAEAMSAGAVPLVFGAGGPAEIVRDGQDGFSWRTVDELVTRTLSLIGNPAWREALGKAAIARSQDFSVERFKARVRSLWDQSPGVEGLRI